MTLGYVKFESFCMSEFENIQNGRKIFPYYTSDGGLVSRIHKELQKVISTNKTNFSICQGAEEILGGGILKSMTQEKNSCREERTMRGDNRTINGPWGRGQRRTKHMWLCGNKSRAVHAV